MSIRLRFVGESAPFAKLIRFWTWDSKFSHVEFVFTEGYLGARPISGVRVRPFDYIKPKYQAFATVTLEDSFEDSKMTQSVETFARSQIGKPYDYLGIVGFVIKHDFNDTHRWFCSALIAEAFEQAGCPLLDLNQLDRISPRDLTLSERVKFDSN